jgi:hypothetical protein
MRRQVFFNAHVAFKCFEQAVQAHGAKKKGSIYEIKKYAMKKAARRGPL